MVNGIDFNSATVRGCVPYICGEMANMKILLASNSPRRRELLGLIVPEFEIAEPREVDETYPPSMPAHEVPVYLSQLKAGAYAAGIADNELIITADTVVIDRAEILGKPHGRSQAIDMLRQLSGHTHAVVTGVTLTAKERSRSFAETTEVTFRDLTGKEIEDYVDIFRPFDKAGAYGIQEWIGAIAISGINGCFYNVMGLPLHALYMHLRDFFGKSYLIKQK